MCRSGKFVYFFANGAISLTTSEKPEVTLMFIGTTFNSKADTLNSF